MSLYALGCVYGGSVSGNYDGINISYSSGFAEPYGLPEIPKALPAKHESVLPDESEGGLAALALATVLAEFTRVGSPLVVGHLW